MKEPNKLKQWLVLRSYVETHPEAKKAFDKFVEEQAEKAKNFTKEL